METLEGFKLATSKSVRVIVLNLYPMVGLFWNATITSLLLMEIEEIASDSVDSNVRVSLDIVGRLEGLVLIEEGGLCPPGDVSELP